jgi:Domain of unknown function (DUF4160)
MWGHTFHWSSATSSQFPLGRQPAHWASSGRCLVGAEPDGASGADLGIRPTLVRARRTALQIRRREIGVQPRYRGMTEDVLRHKAAADEANEPAHIHVEQQENRAKFWLIQFHLPAMPGSIPLPYLVLRYRPRKSSTVFGEMDEHLRATCIHWP